LPAASAHSAHGAGMLKPNPYELPDGNVLISFSGGRTSGFMLHQIMEANGGIPDRCKVLFANTGREMPETMDFVAEVGERWGVPITWVEFYRRENKASYRLVDRGTASDDGQPFSDLIAARKYLPNVVTRFCTSDLKIKPIKRFLIDAGWTRWSNTVGIRFDEARRIKPDPPKERWGMWYPLFDAGVEKADVMAFWSRQPFDLRLFGTNGVTPKGNCDGCFLKSEATLAAMWRDHPERMQWWAEMEEKVGSTFNKSRSYAQLGDFVQRQGDWVFNNEAFLCQTDGGECVI